MCGIVGTISYNTPTANAKRVRRATDTLANRGPDDSGVWIEGHAALGHRRLSILDTSQAGHQPMFSEDGRFVIVYNGEIYNFIELKQQLKSDDSYWSSSSDTEVVLAAFEKWGPLCLEQFHGFFAFVIWDRKEESLFAARDRMGVKPFYYHYAHSCFAFGSRVNALFSICPQISEEVDKQALRLYLECGYIPSPYSIYGDIRKLPPAHYLLLTNKRIHIERYWDFRHIQPELSWQNRSEEELLDELDEIVTRCVKSRMISDVPLGAFLSGGIDSSLVTALMTKNSSRPIKTFTIGFKEKEYDESVYARSVAQYLETEFNFEILTVDDLLKYIPISLKELDEPFFDYAILPTFAVSKLARKHVTVSLSGDGGDELFGGYHYYRIIKHIDYIYNLPKIVRIIFASLINIIPKHQFKLLSGALKQKRITSAFAFMRSISKDFCSVLSEDVTNCTFSICDIFSQASKPFPVELTSSEQGMRLDAFFTLSEGYLQKLDIASMAFSLEAREPLLDHKLIEWSIKLPVKFKLNDNQNKYLLRKLAYRYIPRSILDRPKHGFEVPIKDWIRGPLKKWAEERLHDSNSFKRIPLNQKNILNLYKIHNSGKRDVHPLLWAVLMLIEFVENMSKSF